jgi:hypothetical protein
MGYALWSVFRVPLARPFQGNEEFGAVSALIIWSIVGGLAGAVFLYLAAARITGKAWVAGITAAGFAGTHAVMNYAQTGCAYTAGAACQLRRRLPFLAGIAGSLAATVVLVYAVVMPFGHITSVQAAVQWMVRSRYGISPTMGYPRMLAGIPRSFFSLGVDGATWKRFLLAPAGSRLNVAEIAHTGIWKVVVVYGVLGMLVFRLWKSSRGRILLVSLAAVALPGRHAGRERHCHVAFPWRPGV